MKLRFLVPVLPLAIFTLALAGCGDQVAADDPNLIAATDYESVLGWQPSPDAVTRDHAHSGKFAVMVAPGHDFAGGYGMPIGKATARKPHKLHLEGWGYMTDSKSSARLSVQLLDPATGKQTFGDGIDYTSAIKEPKKWTKIEKDVVLPETTASTYELRVFLWRSTAETPAYLDDLRISLVD